MPRALFVLVCSAPFVLGCGGGNATNPGGVPVSGTVKFNGAPLTKGLVTFQPAQPGEGNTATGEIRSDGSFTLGTAAAGDGAKPGSYKVAVRSVESEATMDAAGKPVPAKSAIPEKYGNTATSGLTAIVDKGKNAPVNLELSP